MPVKAALSHPWNLVPAEAMRLQRELAQKVRRENGFGPIHAVAGVDVGIKEEIATAAIVVLEYPSLVPLDCAVRSVEVEMPYIPGLLAFREGPAVLAALEEMEVEPDLFIFDGQGLAHPRRLGIASHMGVILDRPSIGCAKTRLWGTHIEPDDEAGSRVPLYDRGEVIGAVVRTRTGVKPIYVSIGHRIDLDTAVRFVITCCRGLRLPETSRLAHQVAAGEKLEITRAHQGRLPF